MPGVGICAPMRYTAKRASVKRTRFRKSGMRNMFRNASKNLFMCCFGFLACCFTSKPFRRARRAVPLQLRYDFERTAGLGDLVFGRLTESVRVNRELYGQVAVAENLDLVGPAADAAVGATTIGRDGVASRKNVKVGEIENRVRHAEQIVKAALGHAAMQWVLAAFKTTAARRAPA